MKRPELKRIGRLSGRNVPYPPPPPPAPRQAATCKCTHSSTTTTIPDRIVEAAQAGAVWQWWPTRASRPAIRDRISAGIVLHFLTRSPSLLFLSPFFASKYLEPEQFFPSSGWKYGEVGVVCFTSTGQTWNQSSSGAISSIKMNSFVQKPWPASSGPPDGASCAPAFVSPAAPTAATRPLL